MKFIITKKDEILETLPQEDEVQQLIKEVEYTIPTLEKAGLVDIVTGKKLQEKLNIREI